MTKIASLKSGLQKMTISRAMQFKFSDHFFLMFLKLVSNLIKIKTSFKMKTIYLAQNQFIYIFLIIKFLKVTFLNKYKN